MRDRNLKMLEFGKLLEYLAGLAVSDAGREKCLLIRPARNVEEIERKAVLFDEIRLWKEHSQFKLRNFPDLGGVISFLDCSSEFLDMDGLWAVREMLCQAREVEDMLGGGNKKSSVSPEQASLYWPGLKGLFLASPRPQASTQALLRCINDDGLLDDNSSPELVLIRGEVRAIHQQCTRKVKEFAKNNNIAHYLQEDFMTLSSDRYVLPLKSNFKGHVEGIIHDYSQTGETCYFEPLFLISLNNKLQELKREEREEERKVLRYLSGILRSERDSLVAMYEFMVELDVELAKVALAEKYHGRMLRLQPEAPVCLVQARHPLLVLMNYSHVVPVDIALEKGHRALIISGGNAGGKTVSLKTLGLIALMAMASIPVPVGAGSVLPAWENVFAFIGDEQSLNEHVSTFTAQIEHLSRIWAEIDEKSLVILDEFGAGTDPAQGSALAQAVVDEILRKNGYVIAATHFPAFKAYALSRDDVRAASVLFDENSKKPLYTLVYDQVGASLALDVAKANGLPDEIIRQAEKYLLMEGQETSVLISRLNSLAMEREKEIRELEKERGRLEEIQNKLAEKFEKEHRNTLKSLDESRRQIMADIRTEKTGRKQALKELSEIRQSLASLVPSKESEKPADSFANASPGSTAQYIPWLRNGVIEEIDHKKQRAKLDFNGVSIWAAFADLKPSEATGPQASPKPQAEKIKPLPEQPKQGLSIPLRVDLRGSRAEEALRELERQIDHAMLSGRDALEVVHGRGTGALRREIHQFLAGRPGVAHYYTANEDQGGDGVTIVELK